MRNTSGITRFAARAHASLHRFAVLLASPAGLALMLGLLALGGILRIVLSPIGTTPDVWEHMYRTSAILNGDLVARPVSSVSIYHGIPAENVGGCVDTPLVRLSVAHASRLDLGSVTPSSVPDWSRACVDVPFNNTAIYPLTTYTPQVLGLLLAGLVGLGASGTYWLIESVTLVVFLVCAWAALRMLPAGVTRNVFFLAVLFVTILTGADMALSADSFTFALIVLFASCLLRAFDPRRPVTMKLMVAMALLGVLITVSKIAYAPMLAMLWVVCLACRHAMSRPTLVLGVAAVPVGWTLLLLWMRIGINGYVTSPTHVSSAMVSERTIRAITRPWEPAASIVWSVLHAQIHSSWDRPRLVVWWLLMVVLALMLARAWVMRRRLGRPGERNDTQSAPVWPWTVCFALVLASALLGYLALWMQYTPDGAVGVLGVQTRYFWLMAPFMAAIGLSAAHVIAAARPECCSRAPASD